MPFYWQRHPDGPFATLIRVTSNYLDPENYDLESLQQLARRDGDPKMQVFKAELQRALLDPGLLPGDELCESVEYADGSDEAFLRRLWRDLYGDEPPPRRKTLPPDHGTPSGVKIVVIGWRAPTAA
jgi:hypothetical protein